MFSEHYKLAIRPEEKEEISSDTNYAVLINQPNEQVNTPAQPDRHHLFIPAVFFIYALGDAAWQFADDRLGNDNFNNRFPYAYAARCVIVGAAQAGGSKLMNETTSRLCKITDSWDNPETISSFLTGALWLPFVALGQYLATLAGEEDQISTNSIAITSATLATCNTALLYLLQCLYSSPESKKDAPAKKIPSKTADTTACVLFYLQGVFPQPGSPSHTRDVGWAALLSASAAATGEVISKVSVLAANSFWKCVGSCKSRRHKTKEAASEPKTQAPSV